MSKYFKELMKGEWSKFTDVDVKTVPVPAPRTCYRVVKNNKYTVFFCKIKTKAGVECERLMIRRHDASTQVPWRDKQRIKNELLGKEVLAIEFYPPESQLFDNANVYHLLVPPPEEVSRLVFV